MQKPRAVLFDAYGTLFDVYSVGLLAEQLFTGQGARLATLWRDKQIEYTRLVTTSDLGAHYRPFWALTQSALAYAIKTVAPEARSDWPAFEERAARLMNQYRHLSAFPENRAVLQALRDRGVATGLACGQIVFVSSNAWDALAATWYGYRTLWVNRQNLPFEELGTQPHRTGSQLNDVLAFFD